MLRLSFLALLIALLSTSIRENRSDWRAASEIDQTGRGDRADTPRPVWFDARQETTAAPSPGTFTAVPPERASSGPRLGVNPNETRGRAQGARNRVVPLVRH